MSKKIRISLDIQLAQRNMTRYELSQKANVAYPTVDKYYKNKVSRYDSSVLLRFCTVLNCEVGDIIEIVDE